MFCGCPSVGLCVWLFLGDAPAGAAAHAGSPCALAGACGLGFLVPDSIDFDHVVQVMSARLLHGQVAHFLGQVLRNHVNISFLIIHFPFYSIGCIYYCQYLL